MEKKRVGVLISGSGSNLQALIDACIAPEFPAEIVLVVSNKADAYGLERAKMAGIPAQVVSHKDFGTREEYDRELDQLMTHHLVDVVCLAGFMRILSDGFVKKWHDAMINIHPSLLPSFKGGHGVRDALAAGVKITGCTVHFVRTEMDSGPIIVQAAVPVLPGDDEGKLAARVLEQEHIIYAQALKWFAEGKLAVKDGVVHVSA